MSDSIELNVTLKGYDLKDFERTIVDEVAERIWGEIGSSITDSITEKFATLVDQRVTETLQPIISEAFEQPLQRTDAFGKVVGEPMSMKDVIAGSGTDYLLTHVDPNGKPKQRDRYSSPAPTRLDIMVKSLIDQQFSKEIEKEKATAIRELRGQLKSAAAAWLAEFQGKAKAALDKAAQT